MIHPLHRCCLIVACHVLLVPLFSLHAGEPLQARITNAAGQPTPGFVMSADKEGLTIAASKDGSSSIKISYDSIQEINVEAPKGWAEATLKLNAGDFAGAGQLFGAIANDYANLVPWADGYGSIARLNYFKALKGLGKFADLAAAMDRQLSNPLALSAAALRDFNELRGWAILGKGDMLALQSHLAEFQESETNKMSLLPRFKQELPDRMIASLSYLRGHLFDKQQQVDLALVDYHTAMTYNLGTDRSVFAQAAAASLKIFATKIEAKPDDKNLRRLAHSLAVTYRDCVGKGKVPAEFTAFLEPLPPEEEPPTSAAEAASDETPASGSAKPSSPAP